MTLNSETRIGLTFGQIISILMILAAIFTAWQNLNIRMSTAEIRIDELEKSRTENREDHKQIIEKLDNLILQIKSKE